MKPGTYGAPKDESGEPDPADWPPGKPGRPYGVYADPPGLRREPWMTDEDVANLPRHRPGESVAEWLAKRAAYVNRLRETKRIGSNPAKPRGPSPGPGPGAASPAAEQPRQPAPAEAAESPPAATPPAAATPAATLPAGAADAPAADAAAKAGAPGDRGPAAPTTAPTAAPRPAKPLRRRHEKFCIAYVMRGEATRAAWDAGYSSGSGHNQAYRLLKRPEIQARIAEIQRGLARDFVADAEALLGKLESVYRHCIEAGRYNAAVRVVEVQARMAGHLKTKAEQPVVRKNDEK